MFGPSSMAPIQVQLLQALAASLPVDLYLLTPCPGLWQRCVQRRQALSEALALQQPLAEEWMGTAPPLEARFGRLGAEFQQLLEGTGEAQLAEEREEHLFLRPTRLLPGGTAAAPSLLHQLQEHLLSEELQPTLHLAEGDGSLEFHACPGPLRQVQIVRDRVLQLLAADPTLEPRHILVMTPAVDTFAPLVATVFGDREATGVDLPWRLTDRSQQEEGGVGRSLLEMLALAGDRLTASGLERLLECGPLQQRFGLSAEDAGSITEVLQRCGFRWGLGEGERQGAPTLSVGGAIDRLLLGLVLPETDGTWPTGTAPARPPAPLELGGRALHLLWRLKHWLVVLAQPRRCGEWVDQLRALLLDLYGGETPTDPEITTLHRALEDWRASAEGHDLLLEPAVVGAVLQERLTMESGRFGHRSGALTISALEPMRAIPHRVLVLMGLDAGVFPRQGERPGFHLMEMARRLGDPNEADQDRYALLEGLLSARDTLLITWNCRDERTGVSKPPSAPVQQWLQWLQSHLPPAGAEAILVHHEPNPLASSNFLPQGSRPPASCDRRLLLACRHLEEGIGPPAQGLADRSLAPQEEPLSRGDDPFEELRAWLMDPQGVWLRELGLLPRELREELADLESLELEEWERATLFKEALAPTPQGLSPPDGNAWLQRHRGEGCFPPGQGAALEAERLQERWESLQAALAPLGAERCSPLQWGAWTGCPSLRGDGVVLVHPGRDRAAQRLDLWLQLQLAAAALGDVQLQRGVLIARGSDQKKDTFSVQLTFRAPDPEEARGELARLWNLRLAWRSACWPVPPDTGWTWVEKGGPGPGSRAFAQVVDTWEGNGFTSWGERNKEEMQMCFGSKRRFESLLGDLPFQEQANGLFGPILAAVLSAKGSTG
ncbi:MAG: exodeoxyribonuclease V subunit gamma [Cyanobium sp.]